MKPSHTLAEEWFREAIEVYLESLVAHQENIPRETKSFLGVVSGVLQMA